MLIRQCLLLLSLHFLSAGSLSSQQDDEFNAQTPGGQWHWVRENASHWNMTGTQLEIRTEFGALNGTPADVPSTNSLRNILLQSAPAGTFRVETRLAFSPDTNFQNAGLIYYLDDDNYIRVSRGVFGIYNGVWMEWEEAGKTLMRIIDPVNVASLYLRLSRTNNTTFSATYSLDGSTWSLIGTESIVFSPNLPSPGVGLQAANGIGVTVPDTSISALFDYFRFALTSADPDPATPDGFSLSALFPNPVGGFGNETSLLQAFIHTTKAGALHISICDLLGRRVRDYSGAIEPGGVPLTIPVTGLPTGCYFALFSIGRQVESRSFRIK